MSTRFEDADDYFDLLKGCEIGYALRVVPQDSDSSPTELVEFRFLDTPGINDTKGRDTEFATTIVNEIIATQSFNLILIVTSSKGSITPAYGFALEYYAKVLEGLRSNIAFLYTHVDYYDCHHTNSTHHSELRTRQHVFSRTFRDCRYLSARSTDTDITSDREGLYRHFTIDLVDVNMRPIIQCLNCNTLRDILQLAVTNSAAELDTSTANLDRIRAIAHPGTANLEIRKRFRAQFRATSPTRQQEDSGGPSGTLQQGPRVEAESKTKINIGAVLASDSEAEDYFRNKQYEE